LKQQKLDSVRTERYIRRGRECENRRTGRNNRAIMKMDAEKWVYSRCGSLDDRLPFDVITSTGSEAEVERILNCIDHGMIA